MEYGSSRRPFVRQVCGVLLALGASACQAGALTDLLVAKVGVSQPQADGGAGSIFKLARAQMTAENFQKLRTVVPGLDGYLGAAPAFLPNEGPVAGHAAGLAGLAGNRAAQGAALAGGATGGSAQGAALTSLAGGGSAKGAALAALAGGGSTKGAALAGIAGGGSTGGALAGLAGGGSATGALAAAAMGQPLSPTDALKAAARNKLSQTLGEATPGGQGGMAGVAVGALGANGGGSPLGAAASSLLAGTALGDKLQAAQALAPAFQQLGMDQGMVARFLPVVIDYVKSVGGKSSSKLLTHALGF